MTGFSVTVSVQKLLLFAVKVGHVSISYSVNVIGGDFYRENKRRPMTAVLLKMINCKCANKSCSIWQANQYTHTGMVASKGILAIIVEAIHAYLILYT